MQWLTDVVFKLGNLVDINKPNTEDVDVRAHLLVHDLANGSSEWPKKEAIDALHNFASSASHQTALAQAGAIPLLMGLMSSSRSADGVRAAARALGKLAWDNAHTQRAVTKAGCINSMVSLLSKGSGKRERMRDYYALASEVVQEDAIRALGRLAWNNTYSQRAIARAGAIPCLVSLLHTGKSDGVKWAAGRTLARLAWDNADNQGAITHAGAIPALMSLYGSSISEGVRAQAFVALWALARDNPSNQATIAQTGVKAPLASGLSCCGGTTQQALHNLVENDVDHQRAIAQVGAMSLLVSSSAPDRIKETAVYALKALVHCDDRNQGVLTQAGVVAFLVALLNNHSASQGVKDSAVVALRKLALVDLPVFIMSCVEGNNVPANISRNSNCSQDRRHGQDATIVDQSRNCNSSSHSTCDKQAHDSVRELVAGALIKLAWTNANNHKESPHTWGFVSAMAGAIPPLVILKNGSLERSTQKTACSLRHSSAMVQCQLLDVLRNMAYASADNRRAIAQSRVIPALVSLLSGGTCDWVVDIKEVAAEILACVAYDDAVNQRAIAQAGAIHPLVALLHDGVDDNVKVAAADALGCLAYHCVENQRAITQAKAIPALVAMLRNRSSCTLSPYTHRLNIEAANSEAAHSEAAGALWILSTRNTDNQRAIADAGAIPPLVSLLSSGSDEVQENVAGALMSLAFGNCENQRAIAQAGGIVPLVSLLSSESDGVKEQAAGALLNLTCNVDSQKAVAQAGAVPCLVSLLSSKGASEGLMKKVAGLVRNLAAGNADQRTALAHVGAIPPLVSLLANSCLDSDMPGVTGSSNGVTGASNGVTGSSNGVTGSSNGVTGASINHSVSNHVNNERVIACTGVHPCPVPFLSSKPTSDGVLEEVVGAVGNLASGNVDNQGAIAHAGAIPALLSLLSSAGSSDGLKVNAVSALCNLACSQADVIVVAGAEPVLSGLASGGDCASNVKAASRKALKVLQMRHQG